MSVNKNELQVCDGAADNVLTHRYTARLDFQSDFLHIHHTAVLQTQSGKYTVLSPECITTTT